MEKLEYLIAKRENLYNELKQIKNRKKELMAELYELKKKDSMKTLEFLHFDNQIAILEVYNKQFEKPEENKNFQNEFLDKNNDENCKKNTVEKSSYIKILINKDKQNPEGKQPLENKTVLSNEDFDKFQDEYYKFFRSMLPLAITDNVARLLSKMSYQDWMLKKEEMEIFLQKSGRSDTYRGKEIEKENQIYCIVAPPKAINYSEADVVKNALDKFFDIEGILLPNNVKQKEMEIIMPAVFIKRADGYYELNQKGSLKFN